MISGRSPVDLRRLYDLTLLPELRTLDRQRMRLCGGIVGLWIVTALVTIAAFAVGSALEDRGISEIALTSSGAVAGISLFGAWFFVLQSIRRSADAYVDRFKSSVIGNIVRLIDPSLTYVPDSCVSRDMYNQSGLFPQDWDAYDGDDFVSGRIGATPVEFSEVHTRYDASGENQRRKYRTVFHGLFFACAFNKVFVGRTYVLPDRLEKTFGQFGAVLQRSRSRYGERVKLQDPTFEERFVVYGTDQTVARYVLSTGLMARLTAFRSKARQDIRVAFVDSIMYVAISFRRNLFEPRVWRSLLDFGEIQTYFENLQLVVGIVEDLNLNTRIWGERGPGAN